MSGVRRSLKSKPGVNRIRLVLFATPEEKLLIKERARRARMSVSHYLIQCGLRSDGAVTFDEMERLRNEIHEMQLQLIRVGTNLNQVAKHANTVSEIPSDFAACTKEINAALAGVNSVLRAVASGEVRV